MRLKCDRSDISSFGPPGATPSVPAAIFEQRSVVHVGGSVNLVSRTCMDDDPIVPLHME
jgi:hypothetical protein